MGGWIRNKRGAGGLGCLIMTLAAGAGIYAGTMLLLPHLRNRSFEDRLNETFAFFSRQPEKNIRERIIQVASEFHIDLTPAMVRVDIKSDRLTLDIRYEKVVDLKYWRKTIPFEIHREGPY